MKVYYCVQMSPEWHELRRGIPSASNADRILTAGGKPSAQMDKYICELVAERFSLIPKAMTERPMNAAMRHGIDTEPEARRWYTLETNNEVQQVGFCTTDDGQYGASPDGLVGEEGLLELKCVQGATQVEYVMNPESLLATYRPQVHMQLLVTARKWVDLVSYSPGIPGLILRVVPDEYTVKLAAALAVFSEKFQAAKAKIGGM